MVTRLADSDADDGDGGDGVVRKMTMRSILMMKQTKVMMNLMKLRML